MTDKKSIFYVENLTFYSWLFFILPFLLKENGTEGREAKEIYYFNDSKLGLWIARLTSISSRVKPIRIDFSQGEVRDEDGQLVWMKTMDDLLSIQEDFENNDEFQKAVKGFSASNQLKSYLSKCMASCNLFTQDPFATLKIIFLIRLIHQRENPNRSSVGSVTFFMEERPWSAEFGRFAKGKGINVILTGAAQFYIKLFFLRFGGFKSFIKQIIYQVQIAKYRLRKTLSVEKNSAGSSINEIKSPLNSVESTQARIMVEYYGHLNCNSPQMFSDLFFFQGSRIPKKDILVYFGHSRVPVTDKEWGEIKEQGMSGVAINFRAVATPNVPVFQHKPQKKPGRREIYEFKSKKNRLIQSWLDQHISHFYEKYDYWVDFMTRYNVKMHVAWYKHDAQHSVMLEALQKTGGVGVVYQRSFEHAPNPWTLTTADVACGFSHLGVHVGRDKHSVIPYYVVVGFLGDHRFELLRNQANQVRNSLKSKGAKKIVAYFDENATGGSRWDLAYKVTLENYSFLLNKVLENPEFGLVLKPKVPTSLRSRLGPVSELLRRAEQTGRCFVFAEGILQGSYPPCVAAMAADVAIHGHFFAATAGVESALTGTRTLLLDSEGMTQSHLDSLRAGNVVFKDIESLWKVCLEYWKGKEVPKFGDWAGILNEMDPFRDGRAAERMSTYLEWIMEGFNANLPRETILADAAERYRKIWGQDKVLSVNCHPRESVFVSEHS